MIVKIIDMMWLDTSINFRTLLISRHNFLMLNLINMTRLDTRTNLRSLLISRHNF